ncbi:MAG: FAD-binding protein, partial [Chloroflexota bacterium]|nr:FAD-binding protein [Chloroflexota bacterium]
MILNDVQSKLNETNVAGYEKPDSIEKLDQLINSHSKNGNKLCPSGALHSMGGQQFIGGGTVISNEYFQTIQNLNPISKSVDVGSGVTWPMLVNWLNTTQKTEETPLSIIQKQTGADELSLGGAISSNIHGRV